MDKKNYQIFNLSPLPMWILNFDTLAFLDVNVAALTLYGYSREEFLNLTLKDLKPPEQLDLLKEALVNDYSIRNQTRTRSVVHQLKNGALRNLELKIAPLPHEEENINIVIATDVTERLFYINAIEEQNEQLRKISWMQSHTIRAPLSRIMGLVPLILAAQNDQKDTELLLNYLKSSAEQLDEVINEISKNIKIG